MSSSAVYQPRSSSAGPIDAISQSSTATGARSSPKITLPMRTSPHSTERGGSSAGRVARGTRRSRSATTEGASPSKVHSASCSHQAISSRSDAVDAAELAADRVALPRRRVDPGQRVEEALVQGPLLGRLRACRATGRRRAPRRGRGPSTSGITRNGEPSQRRVRLERDRSGDRAPRARRRPAAPPPACRGRRSGTAPAPRAGGAPRADRGRGSPSPGQVTSAKKISFE